MNWRLSRFYSAKNLRIFQNSHQIKGMIPDFRKKKHDFTHDIVGMEGPPPCLLHQFFPPPRARAHSASAGTAGHPLCHSASRSPGTAAPHSSGRCPEVLFCRVCHSSSWTLSPFSSTSSPVSLRNSDCLGSGMNLEIKGYNTEVGVR